MTNKMIVDVWLVGATYFDQKALTDLDNRFRNTEEYRNRLRTLTRVCRSADLLAKQTVALGIAAKDKAAISFLTDVTICKLSNGFLVIGSIGEILKCIKRKPKNEIAIEIRRILEAFG